MSNLGFCAPCAAAVINPGPIIGLEGWKSELATHLQPMVPWLLLCGYLGWKAGSMYSSSICLKREAALKKRRRKRKKR